MSHTLALPSPAQRLTFRLLLAGLWASVGTFAAADNWTFLTTESGKIYEGEKEFRFLSMNIPNLQNVEDAFSFTGLHPWRWPDEFEIEDALESVRQMGGTVVRTYVLSVFREGADAGKHVYILGPGQFNEDAFRTLDKVLEVAAAKGIRVIVPLVDQWHWQGGIEQYAQFRGKPAEAFWTDPQVIADFKKTVAYVVNRRNRFTGKLYRDDPALFGWETGNEISPPPKWTREIAAYLKKLDPNHLVIDGHSLHGIQESSLSDPNVDVVTTHHYPSGDRNMVEDVRRAIGEVGGRKPYFVGEFGFVPTQTIRELVEEVSQSATSGALLWSLRFHRREGGFYWHSEPAGGGLYKAYHWPGFDSGNAYDERQVLAFMREEAFAIRGLPLSERAPPRPPHLLPIDDSAHISWQGSAGAGSYDLQRSPTAEGPWTTIAADLSDAATQYRPLASDPQFELRSPYFYRVVAKNEGGQSAPSNVVGPVLNSAYTLVDELVDLSNVAAHSGDVALTSKDARRTQEDSHRLAAAGGAHLTYQVAGPVDRITVWAFAEKAEAGELELSGSSDGESFQPLQATREVTELAANDYGYWLPVRYRATIEPQNAVRWVRITFGVGGTAGDEPAVELSRVEIRSGPPE